ncbi:MAG TPA: hypothetical protein VJH25_00090 [Candidatus Paceibacterota bacterium]
MNEKTNTWKNPLIAIVVLALVGMAGYFYTARDRATDDLLTGVSAMEGNAIDGDLLKTLGKLKKLKLDESIFGNESWLSLHDFGRTLTPEPKGRANPFAPLISPLGPKK